jgi:aminotransferase EvaB
MSLWFDSFREELKQVFEEVFESKTFILGDRVSDFEGWLARALHKNFAVSVANGTDALEMAIRCLRMDNPEAKIVLTVANSAPATVTAILRAGCVPYYTDVDSDGQMCIQTVLDKVKWGRVLCILPVHLHGMSPHMDAILHVANQHGVPVIEDAAQAFGSNKIGNADMTCLSFYPTKNLGALGDGGAIVTSSSVYAERLKAMRFYGIYEENRASLQQTFVGQNSRLDELQAGFLKVMGPRALQRNEERKNLAMFYLERIPKSLINWTPGLRTSAGWHIFAVSVRERDKVRRIMANKGIQTAVHYPIAQHEQFATWTCDTLPMTEWLCETTLSLPLYEGITQEQQREVVEALMGAL